MTDSELKLILGLASITTHSSLGDPIISAIMPLAFLGILSVSYFDKKRVLNPL